MISILVYCPSVPHIEQLLSYSSLFELQFHISKSRSQALSSFTHYKPQYFVVECNNITAQELHFVRSLSPDIPTLVLTRQDNEPAAVKALQDGADYLLHYPCGSIEFYHQLNNFIRLTTKRAVPESRLLHIGELTIFLNNNQVMLRDEFLPLTTTEYKLLIVLANNLNQIVSTEKLYNELYSNSELKYTSRALNMHISNLRHKLHIEEFALLRLETVRGKGYALYYSTEDGGMKNG